MKEKHSSEVIYALADYKQLVLAYRTKHAELVKALTFWKTSVIWLCAFITLFVVVMTFWLVESGQDAAFSRKNTEILRSQVATFSGKLAGTEKELAATRDELKKKEEAIQALEKNISTASKKLLEKLLSEQESQAAKQ